MDNLGRYVNQLISARALGNFEIRKRRQSQWLGREEAKVKLPQQSREGNRCKRKV